MNSEPKPPGEPERTGMREDRARRSAPMSALASPIFAETDAHRASFEGVTDPELVERARGGDEAAYRELVDRHKHRIHALCFRVLRDADDAEDAAQEAFVKAFRRLDSFRGDSQFYTWLYRIAANVANDHHQARRRRKTIGVEDPAVLAPPHHDDPARPDRAVERDDMGRVARRALERIPPIFRTVLVLREYEGLEYREIAEVLDISVGTVMSRLFRARVRFRDAVERLVPGLRRD